MMRQETFRPVLERLLATRRARADDTQPGSRRGMRVLFTGHSGKNRLRAAQLFAHELSVDLYEIDLDRIVSRNDRPGWDCWGWEAGLYRRRTILQRQPLPIASSTAGDGSTVP